MKYIFLLLISVLVLLNAHSQTNLNNSFVLGTSYIGGDGITANPAFDFSYYRAIGRSMSLYANVTITSGENDLFDSQKTFEGSRYLGEESKDEGVVNDFASWYSLSIGASVNAVKTTKAHLSIFGGLRYYHLERLDIVSSGTLPDFLVVSPSTESEFGPELGVRYTRFVKENFSLGGTFLYAYKGLFFGAGVFAGVQF